MIELKVGDEVKVEGAKFKISSFRDILNGTLYLDDESDGISSIITLEEVKNEDN